MPTFGDFIGVPIEFLLGVRAVYLGSLGVPEELVSFLFPKAITLGTCLTVWVSLRKFPKSGFLLPEFWRFALVLILCARVAQRSLGLKQA